MVSPGSRGSGADIAGRIIAQRLNEHWKQPVVVENRPGAGGQIGTAAVVKADPDGHTLLVQSSSHAARFGLMRPAMADPQAPLPIVTISGVSKTYASGFHALKRVDADLVNFVVPTRLVVRGSTAAPMVRAADGGC